MAVFLLAGLRCRVPPAIVVPKEMAGDVRCMLHGKMIHVARDAAKGGNSFSTQLAACEACASGKIDQERLKKDRKVAKLENSAKHVSFLEQRRAAANRLVGPVSARSVPECWDSSCSDGFVGSDGHDDYVEPPVGGNLLLDVASSGLPGFCRLAVGMKSKFATRHVFHLPFMGSMLP